MSRGHYGRSSLAEADPSSGPARPARPVGAPLRPPLYLLGASRRLRPLTESRTRRPLRGGVPPAPRSCHTEPLEKRSQDRINAFPLAPPGVHCEEYHPVCSEHRDHLCCEKQADKKMVL
ncbi:hypothetical protein AOLI_G00041680 [Acnodon oligacanthus]